MVLYLSLLWSTEKRISCKIHVLFVCYREDIRSILKKAEKAKNNDHFRHSLKILAGLINQPESTYKREWIHMLSLDDGIESAILQKEPYMNMAAKKLEKTSKQLEQLLHIDMAIAPENERYNLLKLDLDLKINARYVNTTLMKC